MQAYHHILLINTFVGLLVASSLTKASQIPLRVNPARGVFMQEIWHAQHPLVCVANTTDKNQSIEVFRRHSSLESDQALALWQADAGSVICHAANKLQVPELLEYHVAGGEQFGLLRAPALPQGFIANDGDTNSFVALQGLNGGCATPGTWIESDKLAFKSGQLSKVHLLTKGQSTELLMEFPVSTKIPLPQLLISDVSSTSLHVYKTNEGFSISAATDKEQTIPYRVTMEFIAPQVTQPTLFLLSGRKRAANNGWGCFVRGIVIEP